MQGISFKDILTQLFMTWSLYRDYVRGSRVKLRLEALELSTKFLGASKDLTLREADGLLMGVLRSKARKSSAV